MDLKWKICSFSILALSMQCFANPKDPTVVAGKASFESSEGLMQIKTSDKAIINWKEFSIDAKEATKFIQPHSSSAVLNKVTGNNPSALLGHLEANGKVYLINQSGILISKDAIIDTKSFIASTLDLPNALFLKDENLFFKGKSDAAVINHGTINAWDGDVVLIGLQVENTGKINAPNGLVGLAAGQKVLIKPTGEERIYIFPGASNGKQLENGIINSGDILALQAELKAYGNPYAKAINHSGNIDALGVEEQGGRIYLVAPESKSVISGKMSAEHADSNGGEVYLLGQEVEVQDGARIDVSGVSNGGKVFIGGFRQEEEPPVTTSLKTTVREDAEIFANSQLSGEGGTIFIWGDECVHFAGYAKAQGGALSGNGGIVDISGKGATLFEGIVDTQAKKGESGILYLDFSDLMISHESLAQNHINTGHLVSNLNTTNVEISGRMSDLKKGDILLLDPLNYTSSHRLSIESQNDIHFNAHLCNAGTGEIAIEALGNINFNTDVQYVSSNTLNLQAGSDINILARIQNSGKGRIIAEAGKDLIIGNSSSKNPSSLGVCGGDLFLTAGRDLKVLGKEASAQLGSDGMLVSSNICIESVGRNVIVQGGTSENAYALIGHGGMDGSSGFKMGNISIEGVGGDFIIESGLGAHAFAQVGHSLNQQASSIVSGDVELTGASNLLISSHQGNLALFGHGGNTSSADSLSGNVTARAAQITVDSGQGNAALGFFVHSEKNEGVTVSSHLIKTASSKEMMLHAADGGTVSVGASVDNGNVTVELIDIGTKEGFTLLSDTPLTANTCVQVGAIAINGSATCNLNLEVGKDLLLIAKEDGIGSSSVIIQNGSTENKQRFANFQVDGSMILQAGQGPAFISSIGTMNCKVGGELEINAAMTAPSFIETRYGGEIISKHDIVLNGTPFGKSAFILNREDHFEIQSEASLYAGPNSSIEQLGTFGNLQVASGGNLTMQSSANNPSFILNHGNGDLLLTSSNDINIYAAIQNPGSGNIKVHAAGDLNIGESQSEVGCQLGSRLGHMDIAVGRDLNIRGGSNSNAFAHIGSEGALIDSSIKISVDRDLILQGGANSGSFSAIGHGRVHPIGGIKSGEITLEKIGGKVLLQAGSGEDSYAQIGHYHGGASSVMASGDVVAKSIQGTAELRGGIGERAYALFGHGGDTSAAGDQFSGSISINADRISLVGGSSPFTFAHIGFTNGNAAAIGDVMATSEQVGVLSQGSLVLQAGSGEHSHAAIGACFGAASLPNLIAIKAVDVGAGDGVLLQGSNLTSSAAQIGVFSELGDAATNLTIFSNGDLTLFAEEGSAAISNGTSSSNSAYSLEVDVNGSIRLQSETGNASIFSVGSLTCNAFSGSIDILASPNASAYMIGGHETTMVASEDITLTGNKNGVASIEARNNNLIVEAGGNLKLDPNSLIQNQGLDSGDLSVAAFGDLSIFGASGANACINNAGEGTSDIISFGDMIVGATNVNSGTGNLNVLVMGTLNVGHDQSGVSSQLGAQNGSMLLFVGEDLKVIAGNREGAFAQIGAQGPSVGGDIDLIYIGGDITLYANSSINTFSMIGHRSPNFINGSMILEDIRGNINISSGSYPDSYAQIGHFTGPLVQ